MRTADFLRDNVSRTWCECGFQIEFAGFQNFESAAAVGGGGGVEEDRVWGGGELEGGRSVAQEFVVNEYFRTVRLGRNRDGAHGIRNERGGSLQRFGGFGVVGCGRRLCGLSRAVVREGHVGIKAVENIEKIRGAEGEADAGDIFLDDLTGVNADGFATRVPKRASAVSGIDGRVCLNPGARALRVKFSDGTDNALGDAEEHAALRIADCNDTFSLAHGGGMRKDEMRKVAPFHFGESDVELRVDVD